MLALPGLDSMALRLRKAPEITDLSLSLSIPKAQRKSGELRKMLTNNRIPPRAKLLVWLAYVRPLLDYGCEVWTPNAKDAAKIESVQTQAGVLMFKLNRKTKHHAVRALMKCTSLQTRRARYRLRYLAKLFTFSEESLVRVAAESGGSRRQGKGRVTEGGTMRFVAFAVATTD